MKEAFKVFIGLKKISLKIVNSHNRYAYLCKWRLFCLCLAHCGWKMLVVLFFVITLGVVPTKHSFGTYRAVGRKT